LVDASQIMVPVVFGLLPFLLDHLGFGCLFGCLLGSIRLLSVGLAAQIVVGAQEVGAVDELSLFAAHFLIKIIICNAS